MKSDNPNKWKKIIKWIPGLLISFLAIFLLFKYINIDDLLSALSKINFSILLAIVFLNVLAMFTRGLAWKTMIGAKANTIDSFFAVCVGYLLNNIIPRSGEIGKAVLMGNTTGLGTLHILSTVIVERALDLAIAATFFLTTLPLVLEMEWLKPIAILMLIVVAGGFVILLLLANNKAKVDKHIKKISKNSDLIRKYLLPGFESILNGFSVLTNVRQFITTLFWMVACWACWTLGFYITLISFIPGALFWWSFFTQGVLAMGIALPSAPAGLGVYEGTMVVALSAFGINESTSLGMALVMHMMQIVIISVLGIIGLSRQKLSISAIIKKINLKKD